MQLRPTLVPKLIWHLGHHGCAKTVARWKEIQINSQKTTFLAHFQLVSRSSYTEFYIMVSNIFNCAKLYPMEGFELSQG